METEVKVFHSEISRVDCDEENHLYDLLKVEPAKPISRTLCTKNEDWDFKQKEKFYLPKRVPSKLKVKTVSDVRALFEKDVYTYLLTDLELQQNYLLKKICDGSSSDDKTRKTAITLLNGDKPISRSSWHMLSNINPERHKHTKQFVLWNGRCIQVNGSKGGKHKFICNYDLKNKFNKPLKAQFKKGLTGSKIGLLRNSLSVKFKPGPLRKKKFLDNSHHKYQLGDVELIKLPGPVLEVSPAYGTVLEPTISSFVNNLRGEKGVISRKLAEFAVSVLGTTSHNDTATQHEENSSITFDLSYKCGQKRILMRRNSVKTTPYMNTKNDSNNKNKQGTNSTHTFHDEESFTRSDATFKAIEGDNVSAANNDESIFEIKQIMNEMLDSVCISLNQDTMYSGEDEPRDTIADDGRDLVCLKDKNKRKYCELDKLDVTIIKLAESPRDDNMKRCDKSFCVMGCVCESFDGAFSLKQHCGVLDCMFGCKCEVSKYKDIEFLEQDCGDLIPGLLNLDNQLNSHMAKEEQKFHQTVILTGDKSILLKSRKRNCKSSKRYEEFYSKKNLRYDEKIKRVLTLDIEKISCENIEPLCMVHNLYKCFCKLKFTESYVRNESGVITSKSLGNEVIKGQIEVDVNKTLDKEYTKDDTENVTRNILRHRPRNTYTRSDSLRKYSSNTEDDDELSTACARTVGYHGRKYSAGYYSATNKKIIEMEENDNVLRKKMLRLINGKNNSTSETIDTSSDSLDCDTIANETLEANNCNRLPRLGHDKVGETWKNKIGEINKDVSIKTASSSLRYCVDGVCEEPQPVLSPDNKASLKKWLETSYKSYKERLGKGILKNCLEAPKKGKAALQSWDFILSRYRERKNIFVVSKQQPFRTFLAVDNKHPFMANCINIDDIRFADLPKYPIIVRNLVTNSTDSENAFCILRGWDHCWELIGAAVKVIEQTNGSLTQDMDFLSTDNLIRKDYSSDDGNYGCDDKSFEPILGTVQEGEKSSEFDQGASEKSKWFVLTVENDFTEIQFIKKGFYVTYEGIQRSINLARISGKTVRLSSRARTDKIQNSAQPYGIYAIPCTAQSCVFIGPYEEHEPLGIEVVKSVLDPTRLKKTRGVWIKTNAVENKNVIDNPLAYLPAVSMPSGNISVAEIEIPGDTTTTVEKYYEQGESSTKNTPEKETTSKHIKPIKIRRTNGFYHLSPQKILQKSENPLLNSVVNESLLKPVDIKEINPSVANFQPFIIIAPQKNILQKSKPSASLAPYIGVKPVAEIAPQIKITNVYSEKSTLDTSVNNTGSMFILKPEEINQKVLEKPAVDYEGATDVEKFLESCTICIAPQEEVLLISDGEEDMPTSKDIWVQCSNVENFGYIRAKLNDDDTKISFEFPGFKYSEFYKRKEAFDKINQVLARKMYVPKNVKLQWQVVREKQHLTCDMLTPKCLEDKKYLLTKVRLQQENLLKAFATATPKNKTLLEVPKTDNVVTYVVNKNTYSPKPKSTSPNLDNMPKTKTEQMKLIEGLEEASRQLEQQSAVLWKEAVTRRDEIFSSLSVPNDLKLKMTGTLEDIMSMNDK